MDTVANFFFKKTEYRSLSNFWPCEIKINGSTYESGEHAFHGQKFHVIAEASNGERQNALLNKAKSYEKPSKMTAAEAKKYSKALILTKEELNLWSKVCEKVQTEICRAKLEFSEVKADLEKSSDKVLVHPALRKKIQNATIWEGQAVLINDKIVILGENLLGKIWMGLR